MPTTNSLDALVVGAGPTGLAMASDLIRHGMRVRIIDKAAVPTTLSKAVVLMPRSLEEFQMRGMSATAVERGEKIHSFSAYNHGEIIFRSEYKSVSSRFNHLINIPQAETERILRDELARLGGRIEWSTTLDSFTDHGDHVSAMVIGPDGKKETVDVPYLMGCSGAHSPERHLLKIEFEGKEYHDAWMLADVKLEWKLTHGHGYAFFSSEGLLAIFPMPDGRYRIYIIEEAARALGREPRLEDIAEAVERIAPGLCKVSEPTWMSEFHCHHRRVNQYGRGRVFIGGDAAHIHSPETGLGMNTGIQDSFNMAWKLAYVMKGRMPGSILDTYNTERRFVGRQVVELSDFAHKMSAQFGKLGAISRDRLWHFMNHFYAHHFKEFEQGLQIRIHYQPSQIVENHGRHESIEDGTFEITAGTRAVDGDLNPAKEGTGVKSLYDLLDAVNFRLLIVAGSKPDKAMSETIHKLAEFTKPVGEYLKLALVLSGQTTEGFESFPGDVFLDPTMEFHYLYGAQKGGLFLIRPDGYIGFSSRPIRATELEKHLRGLFTKLA